MGAHVCYAGEVHAGAQGGGGRAGAGAQHFAFGADQQAIAAPHRPRAIEREQRDLVGDRGGAREDYLLGAVGRGGLDEVDHEIGAHPRDLAGGFGEPGVIADGQANAGAFAPILAGHVEDHPLIARIIRLARAPREDLAIGGQHLAQGAIDARGVEEFALGASLAQGAGDQRDAQFGGEGGERPIQRAAQGLGRGAQGGVGLGDVGVGAVKEMQFGKDHQRDAGVGGKAGARLLRKGFKRRAQGVGRGLYGQHVDDLTHSDLPKRGAAGLAPYRPYAPT